LPWRNWKLASSEVDSVTAEIAALKANIALTAQERDEAMRALLASRSKEAQLSIDVARTAKERDEAIRTIALRKKDYDTLRDALVLSEAMLKGVNADRDKLRDQQKLAALDLAAKVKANAELLLQIAAADKRAVEVEKQLSARKIDADQAAKLLQAQLPPAGDRAQEQGPGKTICRAAHRKKDAFNKVAVNELRVRCSSRTWPAPKKTLSVSGEQIATFQKQLGAIARSVDDTRATIATLQDDKALLNARVKAIQAEADQRFAGIA